nr:MAG: ORF6C domain [Bacteriophage sp.]
MGQIRKGTFMELQIFSNSEFGEIRTITKDNEPMFCLADVCKALEISNVSQLKTRLKEDGVITNEVGVQTGVKADGTPAIQKVRMNFINESNLYKTIFQSRKESAERFTDWVTSEVLPSIRKTGSYGMPKTTGGQIQLLAQGYTELEQAVNSIKEDMTELKDNTPLYGCEIDEVKQHVNRKGVIVLGGKDSEAYKNGSIRSSVYSDIYKQLKREFGCVTTYKSIRRKYIDNVHKFIDDYALPMALAEQVKEANAQISMSF